MTYSVKEIYYTLQGEGGNAGRAAVFLRFAGCNLWTGREDDRASAICQFCDTHFVGIDGPGGGRFSSAEDLATAAWSTWRGSGPNRPLVVCTGGEPMLQMTDELLNALHEKGFEVAVESNGTIPALAGIDWLCISPKAKSKLVQHSGTEIKLVYPQEDGDPQRYHAMDFEHFFLQPMDGPDLIRNTALAAQYCLDHPQWRLSVQIHKVVGLP